GADVDERAAPRIGGAGEHETARAGLRLWWECQSQREDRWNHGKSHYRLCVRRHMIRVLLALGTAAWLSALADAQSDRSPEGSPSGESAVASAQGGARAFSRAEYVGSESCAHCHDGEYDSWRKTLHIQMTKPIAEARVEGDFRSGTRLEAYGRT